MRHLGALVAYAILCASSSYHIVSAHRSKRLRHFNGSSPILSPPLAAPFSTTTTSPGHSSSQDWNWDRILQSRETIVANGNVWPPLENESANDCLILVTNNQYMWHCPEGSELSYERTILYRQVGALRGASSALGTEQRRHWLLDSFLKKDRLMELDTVTGEILQSLIIEGTRDGHDVVRVNDQIFMVDTRNGDVVEIQLPASMPPYRESSIQAGAKEVEKPGYVDIIKRHTGFTREDHINNVAVGKDLLITNLHGGKGLSAHLQTKGQPPSATRLSALLRSNSEVGGGELNPEQDGFIAVENVGNWCHGIAFWEDKESSQIKLISLDSKAGTLVSVVLSGPNKRKREVLWEPNLNHPTLVPPKGIANAYASRAKMFSKGLAVQGNVAYFGISYARATALRQTVPESLLVAVNLVTRTELWTRTIRSNGLINQIVTQSHLGWNVQLPPELPSIEWTPHGGLGQRVVTICEDAIPEDSDFCQVVDEDNGRCRVLPIALSRFANAVAASLVQLENDIKETGRVCCACTGGKWFTAPHSAGKLDSEVLKIEEAVNATATFIQNYQCFDQYGRTKRIPLEMKRRDNVHTISSINKDLGSIVEHLCNLNVGPIQERLQKLGEEGFLNEIQEKHGNVILTRGENSKSGTVSPIQLITSSKDSSINTTTVYHFPSLEDWLPVIQEFVLEPLGIPFHKISNMMFSNVPKGSTVSFGTAHGNNRSSPCDSTAAAHHVHVPILTHADVFSLLTIRNSAEEEGGRQILRIKSNAGEAYELNNAMLYVVRNLGGGGGCVHLILDWMEESMDGGDGNDNNNNNNEYALIKLNPGDVCSRPPYSNELECDFRNT